MNSEPIIARVNWDAVEDAIQDELKGGARNRPPAALFRWWARRPYELIGALLEAAQGVIPEALTVSDPFSGGCTVALEASLRGHRAYAQDVNPWPLAGMEIALNGASAEALDAEGRQLLSRLRAKCTEYHSECSTHGKSEMLTAFRVRRTHCPSCSSECYSFPYGLLTLASRQRQEPFGFFGCTSCGSVTRLRTDVAGGECRTCGSYIPTRDAPLMRNREQECPQCLNRFKCFQDQALHWKLCLIQRKCVGSDGRSIVHFDYPSACDQPASMTADTPPSLAQAIGPGLETTILQRAGFRTWADLYPARQFKALLRAAEYAKEIPDCDVRQHILLVICGAAEMPGHLVRWDRYYPKAFSATDNHRFAPVGVAAEVNPIATQGRGTIARRLELAKRALAWYHSTGSDGSGKLSFHVGSSCDQPIETHTVDLVLTDPPYSGDIQYSELSTPLVAWAEALSLISPDQKIELSAEAVVNRSAGLDLSHYQRVLSSIFKETVRTMKRPGSLLMTFNNRDLRAWYAVAQALRDSDLWVHALSPVISEWKNDHSKKSDGSFTRDLVIECSTSPCYLPVQVRTADNPREAEELIAAGRMLADRSWTNYSEARAIFFSLIEEPPNWITLGGTPESSDAAA